MPPSANTYKEDVDFTALALQYPEFAKRLKQNRRLDFSDPESVRQLTKALLHRDFDITIELPEDRLCPPVPNRFNYILFVQRLVDTTQETYSDQHDPKRRLTGLDIGTGASTIYPLLACRSRPSWRFLATEIDEKSRSYAERNIRENNLEAKIKILDTDSTGGTIIPSDQLKQFEHVDILLTNPPFYSSTLEMLSLAKQKSRPPNSACTGSEVEMITPGGEIAFVSKLVHESTSPQNKDKIKWFSSMLGKLGSVSTIIENLHALGCTNYAVTEFVQGQKTRRWCVAWSWRGLRPSLDVARGTDALEKKLLPFPPRYDLSIKDTDVHQIGHKLNEELKTLNLQWRWKEGIPAGVGKSMEGDVWSRHARRKKRAEKVEQAKEDVTTAQDGEDENEESGDEQEPALAFKISLHPRSDLSITIVAIRWLQGQDSKIFESFCGWLKRKLDS